MAKQKTWYGSLALLQFFYGSCVAIAWICPFCAVALALFDRLFFSIYFIAIAIVAHLFASDIDKHEWVLAERDSL